MNELILKALAQAIKEYPEIIPYLKGNAKQIAEDGVEWHMPVRAPVGEIGSIQEVDWEITQDDIDAAIEVWDKAMPDYAGLLEAENE